MGINFDFHMLGDRSELRRLVDFISQSPGNYQHYDEWVQRAEYELDGGSKKAILAYNDGRLIADLICQKHKQNSEAMEIKNVRVEGDMQGRHVASFLVKQAEMENFWSSSLAVADVRSDRQDIISFMLECGFEETCTSHLYDLTNPPDVTLAKVLRQGGKIILPRVKKIILGNSL